MNSRYLIFFCFAVFTIFGSSATPLHADDDCPPCGEPDNTDPDNNNNAADPVFMSHDPRPRVSLSLAKSTLALADSQQTLTLTPEEAEVLAIYSQSVKANPRLTAMETMRMWQGDYSPGLKRSALMLALTQTADTNATQLYQFMLAALDNPQVQLKEIRRLGCGNGLEKAKAARLYAVMQQNPQLAALTRQ